MTESNLIGDRYEVIRPLGRGTFGQTLLAYDRSLDQQVAVKVLDWRHIQDWKAYELFEREAEVLAALRHPGIPVVHAALKAQWNGAERACLVMEYVEGTPLVEIISGRRHLDPKDVLALFLRLLDVLEYLHTRVPPVLHRDIKPSNIIVRPDNTPALVDFGAVRNVFRSPDESGSTVVGTHGYMPFEQYMGKATPASDLYALAATFLHLLTGRPPSEFTTDAGRIEVPTNLPGGGPLIGVLRRLLLPAPADRHQSAAEVRAALRSETAPAPVPPRSTALVALPPPPRRIEGETRALYKRVAYSAWRLIDSERRPEEPPSPEAQSLFALFSIFTIGILPAVMLSRSIARRLRVRRFFASGKLATARILALQKETIDADTKLTRVRYEFNADGRRHVGADRVLPWMADGWEVGSEIRVLYLPEREYDSVIVSV